MGKISVIDVVSAAFSIQAGDSLMYPFLKTDAGVCKSGYGRNIRNPQSEKFEVTGQYERRLFGFSLSVLPFCC